MAVEEDQFRIRKAAMDKIDVAEIARILEQQRLTGRRPLAHKPALDQIPLILEHIHHEQNSLRILLR
jgi:hypothetical protein